MFATETLLNLARSSTGKELIVGQSTLTLLCDGITEGRIKVGEVPSFSWLADVL